MRASRDRCALATACALLAVLSALPCGLPAAEIFRWVDADGRVQFGDRPPADASAEPVDVDAEESVSGDLEERQEGRARVLEVMEHDRTEQSRAASESQQQETSRREKCRMATDRLQQIETARYIYEPTADPENPRILDDTERAAQLSRAQQDIRKWCG
jgi:hypothetical protein